MDDPVRAGRELLARNVECYVGYEELERELDRCAHQYFAVQHARGAPPEIRIEAQMIREAGDSARRWLPVFSTWDEMNMWQDTGPRAFVPFRRLLERASCIRDCAGLVVDPFDANIQLPKHVLRRVPGRAPVRGPFPDQVEFDREVPQEAILDEDEEPEGGEPLRELARRASIGENREERARILREMGELVRSGVQILFPYKTDMDAMGMDSFVEGLFSFSGGPDSYVPQFMFPLISHRDVDLRREVMGVPVFTDPSLLFGAARYPHGCRMTFQEVQGLLQEEPKAEGIVIDGFAEHAFFLSKRRLQDMLDGQSGRSRRIRHR